VDAIGNMLDLIWFKLLNEGFCSKVITCAQFINNLAKFISV